MKTLIASALIATAALTGAASAATSTSAAAQREILSLIPQAELSGLTAAEIVSVAQAMDRVDGAAQKIGTGEALIKSLQ
ncbi:hypothetical protein CEW88_12365 [Alloyangia pacifica]|uniref:Secreted protein n=1 Tax=Alloyangia pacifica TaxID=311180 RepID=A0A2U8HEV2_9RHOB|nr:MULTISPECIES: hypothetical protein [Roseobacteraceae]AWI84407.1 hypothetical protein CEW88_12365 [Alloyangia pacifica]NDV50427.1 hypothetical protein [Salipiger sp. PrR003]NDW32611.1 hypothetical protein [Salipiger sp. PrR007]